MTEISDAPADGIKMDFLAKVLGKADAVAWATGALQLRWICADTWEREGPAFLLGDIVEWARWKLDLGGIDVPASAEVRRVLWRGPQPLGIAGWYSRDPLDVKPWQVGDLITPIRATWWRIRTADGKIPPELEGSPLPSDRFPQEVHAAAHALDAARKTLDTNSPGRPSSSP